MILKKMTPWILFVACLLLLGLGAAGFGAPADHLLIAFRFSMVMVLSIFIVRQKFRMQRSGQGRLSSDRGDAFLNVVTRWCRGENKRS